MRRTIRATAILSAGLLHYGSLFLPVFYVKDRSTVYGTEVLLMGWAAPAALFLGGGPAYGLFGWYANPLFLVGYVLFMLGRFRASF
jgi:hypothetical protein